MQEHEKHEAQTTRKHNSDDDAFMIKKTTLWQGLTAVFGVLLVISIFTSGFGIKDSDISGEAVRAAPAAAPSAAPPPTRPTPTAPTARAEVEIGDSPVKGDKDAPVTIIEFSDFQCPFCSRFFSQTLPQIQEQYIDTGKVKFVYKHFPLDSIHPQATPAALASECANEQDKFWEYHDIIFENGAQALNDANYRQWAQQLNLDENQFNDCLDSKKFESKVKSELQEGSSAGIRGTPGFLLNGQLISGAQPFTVFQQAIEAELAG